MKKFSTWIVSRRVPILILSLILLVPAAFGYFRTRINFDVLYYLPEEIETMRGQEILMEDFGKGAYAIFVCDEMSDRDAAKTAERIREVDHVASVISLADMNIPREMLPKRVREIFYSKDGAGQLMFIFMDTGASADETMDAIEDLYVIAGEQCFVSSMSCIVTDTRNLVQKELFWYVLIAVVLATFVMALFLDSFLIPLLFLADIGIAIVYNLGTNILQGEISFITMSLAAVLQLGVTMDYSIFLYHSYREKRAEYETGSGCEGDGKAGAGKASGDKAAKNRIREEAMCEAICATITSVTGSSLTTIAGFIALCFMSFTLGLDLGIVMAKGVLLGVACCVTILPGLILIFDDLIDRFRHKPLVIPSAGLARFVTKHYRLMTVLMILLWVPALYGNSHYNVYYKLDLSIPDYLNCVQANKKLDADYEMNSIAMMLVSRDVREADVIAMTREVQELEGITFAMSLDYLLGGQIPRTVLPAELKDTFESDNWRLVLTASEYQVATDEVGVQCQEMNDILKKYDPKGMLIGEAACTKDLIDITDHDFMVVSSVSIGAIFLLILLVLKSALLPVLLVLTIELAIYINMGLAFYTGTTLPFIASVCIGTIQLGATVDYAILMTNRYKQERIGGQEPRAAVTTALTTSMQSIITSALGFFAATIGVGVYSDVDLIGALCMLMARGAIISMLVVLVFLPSLLMLFDGLICRTTLGIRPKHCDQATR